MPIQILRGDSTQAVSTSKKLEEGQPLYITDKNYLTIGDANNNSATKAPIWCREVVGYQGDTSDAITGNTSILYSIGANGSNVQLNIIGNYGVNVSATYGDINLQSINYGVTLNSVGGTVTATGRGVTLKGGDLGVYINGPGGVSQSVGTNAYINGSVVGSMNVVAMNIADKQSQYPSYTTVMSNHAIAANWYENGFQECVYTFPRKSGTVALTSDLSSATVTSNPDGTVNIVFN